MGQHEGDGVAERFSEEPIVRMPHVPCPYTLDGVNGPPTYTVDRTVFELWLGGL